MFCYGVWTPDGAVEADESPRASIHRAMSADDVLDVRAGDDPLAAYEAIRADAAARPGLEGLVLLDRRTELLEDSSADSLRVEFTAGADVVGVLGGLGGIGERTSRWWEANRTVGAAAETRAMVRGDIPRGPADAVAGALVALSPRAVATLRFDALADPDDDTVDAVLSTLARRAGLRLAVTDLVRVRFHGALATPEGELPAVAEDRPWAS